MGYYMGDYYRGAMRRGDPGFLSVLGGIAKTVGGFIPGVGPIVQAIGSKLATGGAKAAVNTPAKPGFFLGATKIVGKIGSAFQTRGPQEPGITRAGAAGGLPPSWAGGGGVV